MADPIKKSTAPISEAHLQLIGSVVAVWSAIEMNMEITICGLYDINTDRGLVLTSNIGFQSRVSLLRILGKRGGIKDSVLAEQFLKLLTRIEAGYAERNTVAHGVWMGTPDPQIARRMSIRAKGDRLRCIDEQVSVEQLVEVAERLDDLRRDFVALTLKLGIRGPSPS